MVSLRRVVGIASVVVVVALFVVLCAPAPTQAAFPGANGRIIYNARGFEAELYTILPDGSGLQRLTKNDICDAAPSWSSDGQLIAFALGCNGPSDIWVMNADGTNPRQLTNDPGIEYFPKWSPDGSKIVFASDRDGNGGLYTMNADGSDQRLLVQTAGSDGEPAWSPDGTHIAFTSDLNGTPQIYVTDPEGTSITQLTFEGANHSPDWSPDSAQITFHRDRDGHNQVYVMNRDGSDQHNVSNNTAQDTSPSWSPDGQYLVFRRGLDELSELWIMQANGTGQRFLVAGVEPDNPDWQPIMAPTEVRIDIRPGSSPNRINPKSNGVIPVAILTTDTFDATTVDPLTVRFGPERVEVHGKGHIRDVNHDGEPDLVLHFKIRATGIQCGDTSASLTGETKDGDPIQGSDTVRTVGCKP